LTMASLRPTTPVTPISLVLPIRTTPRAPTISPLTPIPTRPSFPDDCLPPEGYYDLREALFIAINEWAKTRSYAFITSRSTIKQGIRTVTYACNRRGTPPSPSRRRERKTSTRGTNCLFSILAKESSSGFWSLRHRAAEFSIHNHGPSSHTSAHPIHRQLSSQD